MSCGFFPALDKAGWREAPGWFEAVIPQPGSDSYTAVGEGPTVKNQRTPARSKSCMFRTPASIPAEFTTGRALIR